MKTSIKVVAATVLTLSSSVAMAALTYDPIEEYYAYYYGDAAVSEKVVTESLLGQTYDPMADYYGIVYSDKAVKIVTGQVDNHMADPTNYYNW